MTDAEIRALACGWFDCEQPDPTIKGDTSHHRASRGEHKRLEAFLAAALRDAEARGAEKAAKLLRDLTPGGSEFQTPEECAAHVRQERSGMLDTIKKFKRMADEAEARGEARGRREGEQRGKQRGKAIGWREATDYIESAVGSSTPVCGDDVRHMRVETERHRARSHAQPEPDHLPPCCCHCEHGASADVECSECATLATRGISTSRQPAQPAAPEPEEAGWKYRAHRLIATPEPVLPLGHEFKRGARLGDYCFEWAGTGNCGQPESAHKPSAR